MIDERELTEIPTEELIVLAHKVGGYAKRRFEMPPTEWNETMFKTYLEYIIEIAQELQRRKQDN